MKFVINTSHADVPYFEQYMGTWLMNEAEFRGLAERASSFDVRLHLQQVRPADIESVPMDIRNDIAVIPLTGTLMKHVSSFTGGSSTLAARRQVNQAARDKSIKGILLHIDSPGGTAAGTQLLADAVASARQRKPVISFIEDMGASAAYWIASQADQVFTNSTGVVGSIGTYMVVNDYSALAASQGIKVQVIKAGEMKGIGVPGTEITPDMIGDLQRHVNEINELFISSVAKGRGMDADNVRSLADGRVHVGDNARRLGLVDDIKTFEQSFNSLKRRVNMSATFEELKASCVGADNDFICKMLAEKKTAASAQEEWMLELAVRNEERDKELQRALERTAQLEQEKEAAVTSPGVDPLTDETVSDVPEGTAQEQWLSEMQKHLDRGVKRQKAAALVHKANPGLREAFVQEYNAARP